ncbi:MAG: serine protease [Bacteriovorax sp.]|nr:serine protease [Bacteriovorax sp.]
MQIYRFKLLVTLVIVLAMGTRVHAANISFENTDLIYGLDDRYEADEYADNDFIDKSSAVALRVPSRRLSEDRDNTSFLNFPFRKLSQAVPNICSTEKFVDQYSVGDCSGFLIAPNKLVTAGHCMFNQSECSSNKWVFDFKEGVTQFNKDNVYSCKRIIAQKYIYSKTEVNDYAVIELDRVVLNRKPLVRRKFGIVRTDTPLLVIGHPMGLPMKITDGARVSRMNKIEREHKVQSWLLRSNYFTANLDAYSGSSGSPVFNKNTGKVEGILIQGADDFFFNEETQCLKSRHLSNSYLNTFEKVMRITKIPGI